VEFPNQKMKAGDKRPQRGPRRVLRIRNAWDAGAKVPSGGRHHRGGKDQKGEEAKGTRSQKGQ